MMKNIEVDPVLILGILFVGVVQGFISFDIGQAGQFMSFSFPLVYMLYNDAK